MSKNWDEITLGDIADRIFFGLVWLFLLPLKCLAQIIAFALGFAVGKVIRLVAVVPGIPVPHSDGGLLFILIATLVILIAALVVIYRRAMGEWPGKDTTSLPKTWGDIAAQILVIVGILIGFFL